MINLLTNGQKALVHKVRKTRIVIMICFGLISLSGISLLLFVPAYMTVQERYGVAQKQLESIAQDRPITPEMINSLSEDANKVLTLFSVSQNSNTLAFIDVVRQKSTRGVSISRIMSASREEKKLEIGGVATTRQALQDFENNLRQDDRVLGVESPVSNYVKNTNTVFFLKVTFK